MSHPFRCSRSRGHHLAAAVGLMATAVISCRALEPSRGAARLDADGAALRTSPPLPVDPDLRVVRLQNDVTFLSRSVPANLKRVVLGLVVNVGSLVEREEERGLAHFVEHMAFNGTAHYPKGELVQFLEQLGLVSGADTNAHTTYSSTSYFLELPADDAKALDRAMLILQDWATGIVFDLDAIEQERSVVLAELRHRSSAQTRLWERWMLRGSRHAERGVMGVESVLESASAKQLERFYRRWYQPQNFTIVANGDFDAEAMRRRVEQHFGALPAPSQPEVVPRFEVPVPAGEHALVEVDEGLPGSAAGIYLQRQANGLVSQADYRQGLLDDLLAHLLRRRVQALPSRPGSSLLGANVFYVEGEVGMTDTLQLSAVSAGAPAPALSALLTELERVVRHGFSARELELARAALKRDWVKDSERRGHLRAQAINLGQRFTTGQATLSLKQEAELQVRLLPEITLEEVHRQALAWAQSTRRYLLAMDRSAAKLPSEAALLELAAQVKSAPVTPFKDDPGGPLLAVLPTPGAIASEERIEAIATHVWVLSNGARVVLKPMAPGSGRVSFRATSPGGHFRRHGRELVNARVADVVVAQLGLDPHDAVTTRRLLSEAGIQVTPWVTEYAEGVHGGAPLESLEQMFQALHLTLAAPKWDAAAFELGRRRAREVLVNGLKDPAAFFSSEIERQVLQNHPSHLPLPPEAAEQLDLEVMRAFYRDRFGDVGDFTFVLVGDTTAAQLEPLVRRYLASLPGTSRADGAREPHAPYRRGITRVRVQRGTGDEATVSVTFHGDEPLPQGARRDLDALNTYLEIRLREVLRERLGGVYRVDTSFALREPPREGYEIGFRFDCTPERSEELKRAAFDVIEDLRERGPGSHYVETLKQQRVRAAVGELEASGFWLHELGSAYLRGDDPAQIITRATSTAHISSDALRRSARRYLKTDQYVDALRLPERPSSAAPLGGGPR